MELQNTAPSSSKASSVSMPVVSFSTNQVKKQTLLQRTNSFLNQKSHPNLRPFRTLVQLPSSSRTTRKNRLFPSRPDGLFFCILTYRAKTPGGQKAPEELSLNAFAFPLQQATKARPAPSVSPASQAQTLPKKALGPSAASVVAGKGSLLSPSGYASPEPSPVTVPAHQRPLVLPLKYMPSPSEPLVRALFVSGKQPRYSGPFDPFGQDHFIPQPMGNTRGTLQDQQQPLKDRPQETPFVQVPLTKLLFSQDTFRNTFPNMYTPPNAAMPPPSRSNGPLGFHKPMEPQAQHLSALGNGNSLASQSMFTL